MKRTDRIIATYKSLGWLTSILGLVGAWLWCQTEIFSIYTESPPPYFWGAEGYVKADPIGASLLLLIGFATVFLILIWGFGLALHELMIQITSPTPEDQETRTLTGYVAVAVAAGFSVVTVLFALNYIGHSQFAEKNIREANIEKQREESATRESAGSTNICGGPTVGKNNEPASCLAEQKPNLPMQYVKNRNDLSNRIMMWPGKMGEHFGTFGDFFGGVLNPLLTFGTLIALAVTILMQRIQLAEARGQSIKTGESTQSLAFETTFFNMLSLHADNVKNLTFNPRIIESSAPQSLCLLQRIVYLGIGIPKVGEIAHGRAVFAEVLRSTQRGATNVRPQKQMYEFLQTEHNDVLGHYFRHLYQILDHIDRFKIGKEIAPYDERKRYANILRAQLSSNELSVLILNCLEGMVDEREFQSKLIRYEFLEHASLTLSKSTKRLSAKGIDDCSGTLLFEYFDDEQSDTGLHWTPGAFGKNDTVREFLSRKKSDDWEWGKPSKSRNSEQLQGPNQDVAEEPGNRLASESQFEVTKRQAFEIWRGLIPVK